MKKMTQLMLASAALCASLSANAAEVIAKSNTIVNVEANGGALLFDKFDGSLGSLKSVRIDLYSSLYDAELNIENTGPAANFAVGVAGDLTLTVGAQSLVTHATASQDFNNLASFDGNVDFDGASGRHVALANWDQSNFGIYTTGLSDFIGSGKYSGAVLGSSFQSLIGDSGNAQYYALVTMDGYAKVTYTYDVAPVPEPETYAMLLAGLGLMGVVARRRKSA